MLECIITWAANTLGDEAPHEVGTVLAPVRSSKGVYLVLKMIMVIHTPTYAYSKLGNHPFDELDSDYFVIPGYSGWDPSPNESICIHKAD